MIIPDVPLAKATAAVVKARNTSMIATAPVACFAPSSKLPMDTCMSQPMIGSAWILPAGPPEVYCCPIPWKARQDRRTDDIGL